MEHKLKTVNPYFADLWRGLKTFEVRKNDRNFRLGDTLILQEYNPADNSYSGREVHTSILYLILGGSLGIEEGYCVIALGNRYRNDKAFTVSVSDNQEFLQKADKEKR